MARIKQQTTATWPRSPSVRLSGRGDDHAHLAVLRAGDGGAALVVVVIHPAAAIAAVGEVALEETPFLLLDVLLLLDKEGLVKHYTNMR